MKYPFYISTISAIALSACTPAPICDREAQEWSKFGTQEDVCISAQRTPLFSPPVNNGSRDQRDDSNQPSPLVVDSTNVVDSIVEVRSTTRAEPQPEPEQPTKPAPPPEPEQQPEPEQPTKPAPPPEPEPEQPTKPAPPPEPEPEQPTKPAPPPEPEQPSKPAPPLGG